nr:hypothetical protein [Tanacetum cinerariifolium]
PKLRRSKKRTSKKRTSKLRTYEEWTKQLKYVLMEPDISRIKVKESSRKEQNRIKTGQKREAWRSQEMSEVVTVDRA